MCTPPPPPFALAPGAPAPTVLKAQAPLGPRPPSSEHPTGTHAGVGAPSRVGSPSPVLGAAAGGGASGQGTPLILPLSAVPLGAPLLQRTGSMASRHLAGVPVRRSSVVASSVAGACP